MAIVVVIDKVGEGGICEGGEAMGDAMLALLEPDSGFAMWAADPAQGLTAGVNDGPLDDPDFDGIVNLMEFVLRGDPLAPYSSPLPESTAPSAGSWQFEYDRNQDSVPGLTQIVEYTTNLVDWTRVPIPETSAGTVTITPGVNTDQVSVAIPIVGSSGFARLVVIE